MKNCSSEFMFSTSNPKMSSSPMLLRKPLLGSYRFTSSSSIFSFSFTTKYRKVRSYRFFEKEF